MSRFSNVVAMLTEAKRLIGTMLDKQEDEAFRMRLQTNIQRDIDYLNLLTGTGDLTPVEKVSLPPATTIGGQPINKPRKVTRDDLEPEERKVVTLREKIETLYPQFLNIETKDLLLNYDELVIRGVAKKAKMKVTKDEPAELTLDFIEEIKTEIRHLDEKEQGKNSSTDSIPEPVEGEQVADTVDENQSSTGEPGPLDDDTMGEWDEPEEKQPETENAAPLLENKEAKTENSAPTAAKPTKKSEPKKGK